MTAKRAGCPLLAGEPRGRLLRFGHSIIRAPARVRCSIRSNWRVSFVRPRTSPSSSASTSLMPTRTPLVSSRFHRRGRIKIRPEWRLLMTTHNLTKGHRHKRGIV